MSTSPANAVLRCLRKVAAVQCALDLPDGELLERFSKRRDETAFATLVRRHGPMVLCVCRRILGNEHDAEDAFQATFLVLSRKAASLRPHEALGGWLYSVAYRVAKKARVAAARRHKHEGRQGGLPVADPCAEITLRESQEILDRELMRMPDKFRAPLVLCYLRGLTRDEAAQQLGWPTGTLKTRLEQARERLRVRLLSRGLAFSAALLPSLFREASASAAVPSLLLAFCVRNAVSVATNPAIQSVVSTEVAALTEGVLQTMFLSKVKGALAALVVALALGGTVLGTFRAAAGDAENARKVVKSNQPASAAVVPPAEPPAREGGKPVQPEGQFVVGESDALEAVAFSQDSRTLVGGGQGKDVRIWDMKTKELSHHLKDCKGIVRRVRVSPDGKTVAVGVDGGTILLLNVSSGKLEAELQAELPSQPDAIGINGTVNSIVFLPGGRLAAAYTYQPKDANQNAQGARILIWDIKSRKAVVLDEMARGSVFDLAASPDGKLLAATLYMEGLKVWSLERGEVVWQEKLGKNYFMSRVAFAPNGETLAVGGGYCVVGSVGIGAEGKLWLFDVKTKKQLWCVNEAENGAYNAVAFTADGRGILSGSSGKSVGFRTKVGRKGEKILSELRRWDVANGKLVWRSEGELGWFSSIAASANGKLIAACDNEHLFLLDPETGKIQSTLMTFKIPELD